MTTDTTLYYGQTDPTTDQGDWNRLRFAIQQQMLALNTSMPVRVLSVQAGGIGPVGFVSIQILVDQVTGDDKTVPHGEITNVPYVRLQGGANAIIIDPQVGDIGLACFSSRDISAVKNARSDAPPGSRRAYDFSDAVYIGGLLNGTPTQYIQFTEGGILVHSPNTVTVQAQSAVVEAATVAVEASASIALTAPTIALNGVVTVAGALSQTGGGASTFSGNISGSGDITTTTGDVVASGKSLKTHVHGGVTVGAGNTGAPV